MIQDHDRSGFFGASDTRYIMGNWDTKSFAKWWEIKLGIRKDHFENEAMQVGTMYEHRILEHLNIPEMDKQIIIPELLLRVNLDGNNEHTDYEVKTYRFDKGFKVPKHYKEQVNVQMFASGLKGEIIAYGLKDEDYKNFFNPIDNRRISRREIKRDDQFLNEYLKRLKHLSERLKVGAWYR